MTEPNQNTQKWGPNQYQELILKKTQCTGPSFQIYLSLSLSLSLSVTDSVTCSNLQHVSPITYSELWVLSTLTLGQVLASWKRRMPTV